MRHLDYTFKTYFGSLDSEYGETYFHRNNLFLIVEGVGGEYLGEIARDQAYRIVPEIFFEQLSENNSPGNSIIHALEEANKAIITERVKLDEKMAASISVVYIRDKIMYFTHLGDSRIYSYQGGELNQLTKDHTLREEDPFAEKRYNDPRALRALTQGLGIHKHPSIEVKKYPLKEKGLIIMTTEGLTERISNREILWLSKKLKNHKKLAKELVDLVQRKGGDGQLTLGILKFGGISKGLRNVLMVYSTFFLVVLIILGNYLMRYGGENESNKEPIVSSPSQETITRQEPETIEEINKVQPKIEQEENRTPSIVTGQINRPQEEESQKKATQLFDEVITFITEWKTAWEGTAGITGDLDKYMSFYSDDFQVNRFDKKTWIQDKSSKARKKDWITIDLSDIKISDPTEDGRVEVRFKQDYRSSNFSVVSDKMLILVKEAGGWKIVFERSS